MSINTGKGVLTRVGSGTGGVLERPHNYGAALFAPGATATESHVLYVDQEPHVIRAFGLVAGDRLAIEMVDGDVAPFIAQPVMINGKAHEITEVNNLTAVVFPGRYRLRWVAGVPGAATVLDHPANSAHEFLQFLTSLFTPAPAASPGAALACPPRATSSIQNMTSTGNNFMPIRSFGRRDQSNPNFYLADPDGWVEVCAGFFAPCYAPREILG